MKLQNELTIVALSAAVLTLSAHAEAAGTEFSADILGRGPDAQTTSGKMYVGEGRMRVEMTQQGRQVVRISDQDKHMEWVVLPDQKSYMEHPLGAAGQSPAPAAKPSADTDPCTGLQGVTCRKVGQEAVGGRAAVKWEMSVTRNGQVLTGTQWIDVQRGLPLKYQMPNGQSMELDMVGTETLGGRAVEKWQMTTTNPQQQTLRSFQWYDPELQLSVREEFPGGYVRELSNIRIGKQPDDLFVVPAGYTRMEPPAQPQAPAPAAH